MKTKTSQDDLLEKLAELEHEQWQTWRKTIEWRFRRCVPQNEYTNISYNKLPEKIKEQDRKWARLILKILNQEISKTRAMGDAPPITPANDAFEKWLVKNQWEKATGYAGETNADGSLKSIRKMLRAEDVLAKYHELKKQGLKGSNPSKGD